VNPKTTNATSLPKPAFPGTPYRPDSLAKRSHPKAFWHGWQVFLDVSDTFSVFARTQASSRSRHPTKMTRLSAKVLSSEKPGDQHCLAVKIELFEFSEII
jgi:hypothetical protein